MKKFTPTIPPIISPEYFSRLGDIAPTQTLAFIKLTATLQQMKAARDDIMQDTSRTPEGRLLTFSRLFRSKVEPVLREASESLANSYAANGELKELADDMLKPSNEPSKLAMYAEIRSALRQARPEERRAIIENALTSQDRDTLSAALYAPRYLTNLSGAVLEDARDRYVAKANPELQEKLSTAKKLVEHSLRVTETLDIKAIERNFFAEDELSQLDDIRCKNAAADSHLDS